jgi:hypothetical protein
MLVRWNGWLWSQFRGLMIPSGRVPWVPMALLTRLSSFNAGFSIASLPRSHINSTSLRPHAKLIRFFDPDHSYQIARLNKKSR